MAKKSDNKPSGKKPAAKQTVKDLGIKPKGSGVVKGGGGGWWSG